MCRIESGTWCTGYSSSGTGMRSASPNSDDEAASGDQRQVERGEQAGRGLDHGRHGVHEAHGGGLEPTGVVVAVGPHELEVDGVVGLAPHHDAVAALAGGLGPVGPDVVGEAGDVLEDDDGPAGAHAPDFEAE